MSPRRASSKARLRSINVPSQLVLGSPSYSSTGRSSVPPNSATDAGRANTAELLQSFPAPPQQVIVEHCDGRTAAVAVATPNRIRPAWSLFPRTSGLSPLPWQFSRSNILRRQKPVRDDLDGSAERSTDEHTLTTGNVRGEAQTRSRQSGTPLYDNDRASLRSFDRCPIPHLDGNGLQRRPSLGTRALQPRSSENERAVANGAHRFSSGLRPQQQVVVDGSTFTLCTPPNGNPGQQPQRSHLAIEEPQLCKHRRAKLQKRRMKYPHLRVANSALFDGSSSGAPGLSTTPAEGAATAETPSTNNPRPGHDRAQRSNTTPTTARTIASTPSVATALRSPGTGSTFAIEPMGAPARQHALRTGTLATSATMPGRA